MRKVISLSLCLLTIKASSETYYVSNRGNDCNAGTTKKTAWQTINKINNYSFVSGDSILFKCDDIWNEQLIVPASDITFSSYSTGDKPEITGFRSLCGFTQSGNIWTITATDAVKVLNTILLNNKFAYKSRYPNSGWLPSVGNRSDYITTVVPNTDNYVGDEVVTRTQNWVIDVRKVKAQTSNTIVFDQKLSYGMVYQGGYFFQNATRFIDSVGEFSFDSTNKSLSVYSETIPFVQISTIDTLVLINHKDNVTFDNISFTGANVYTIRADTSHNFTVKNCSINYSGRFGVYASKCRDIVIDNSSIENCYSVGLLIGFHRKDVVGIAVDSCRRATITNNVIKNIGMVAGMASHGLLTGDGERTHLGIYMAGDHSVVKNNRVDSAGGHGIKVHGAYDSIYYNYITNFALNKCDVGGLQTQQTGVAADYNKGMVMYRNMIGNGIGYPFGVIAHNFAPGIYFDQYVNGVTIKENTVFKCRGMSLYLYMDSNVIVQDNNIESYFDYPVTIILSKNISLSGNVLYQRHSSKWIIQCARPDIKHSDNNYYLRPVSLINSLYYDAKVYSYPQLWTDATGFDANGTGTIAGNTYDAGMLYINPTLNDSVINVNGAFVDARGEMVMNTFTLQPYTSKTLFKINTPITWKRRITQLTSLF